MSELKFTANKPKTKNKKFSGNVEYVDGVLLGWVVNNKYPLDPVSLELLVNGYSLGAFAVDRQRPDISLLVGKEQDYGFELNLKEHIKHLPELFLDPQVIQAMALGDCEVSVRIVDSDILVGPSVLMLDLRNIAEYLIGDREMPLIEATSQQPTDEVLLVAFNSPMREISMRSGEEQMETMTEDKQENVESQAVTSMIDVVGKEVDVGVIDTHQEDTGLDETGSKSSDAGIEILRNRDILLPILQGKIVGQGSDGKPIAAVLDEVTEMPEKVIQIQEARECVVREPLIEGYLDSVRGGLATGWAWNRNTPDMHLRIELWVDDVKVAEGTADRLRTDLQSAGIGYGDHAFAIELPIEYRDGRAYTVHVKNSLTGAELSPGGIAYQANMTLRAQIIGIEGAALVGWLAREAPAVLNSQLSVWEGLEQIAQGLADRPSDIPFGAAFHISLPATLFDGYEHHLVVKDGDLVSLGEISIVLPFAIKAGDIGKRFDVAEIEGYVDSVRGGLVEGWVWNRNAPNASLPIEVWVDGKLSLLGKADHLRTDLREAGAGDGYHGFSVELPPNYRDGEAHTILVRESQTGSELRPGPLEYRMDETLRSTVDGVHGATLVGWLAREYPSVVNSRITVWEDGEEISSGYANQPCDVPNGAAFHIPLPPRLFDGRAHFLTVKDENRDHVGEIVETLPYVLTPEDALQLYGGNRLHGYLFNNAARRYESLLYQFSALSKELPQIPQDGESLKKRLGAVFAAHEQIVLGFQRPARQRGAIPRLDFPVLDAPDVSIVIPVHNKFEVTYNCLASLMVSPNEASFEIILVDDGSKDETLNIADLIGGITVLRNETALGFVRTCNKGGVVARGRYIVMLNNDTEVGPRWLDELLHVFRTQDRVGMVGAKLLYPNGTLQEAGGIVWNNGDPWNYGRGANPYDPRYNYLRDVDYLSGACVMLSKPLWDDLRGFDELFAPAYFEDTDLAFRVRAKGLRTIYMPFCEIIHFEGISSGTSTSSGMKRYQEINRPKFKKRHAPACYYNGVVGEDVELNKDRNVRYRALVIDATTPTPDKDAGSYAAIQEMRLLQSFYCKLTFVPENMAYLGQYTEDLQRMGVECVYAPFVTSPVELLRQRGREFTIVYITRYTVAEKYIDAIREFAPQARIVFNNADLHFLREMRMAIANHNPELMEQALKTRDTELAVMREVDLTLSYNEVEHAVILSHNLNSSRVAKCPWVIDLPERVPEFKMRRDIAFLGGYGHHPNIEAVEGFVREVMPLLRERLPGARFLVYGSNPPKSFDALECEDVVIAGWVGDVAEVYDTCRVFVAPLKTGAGLKGKVVGALAHGVPSVLSPIAAEGVGLRDGFEARIATKPAEWAEAIAELYEDETRWLACSGAARRFAATEYSYEHGRILMAEALEQVGIFAEP